MVIELRHRRSALANKELSEIARLTSAQPGREFRPIYLNTSTDQTPVIAKPTILQLQAALAEVEALSECGHQAAALMTAWAPLEVLSRLASDDETLVAPGLLSSLQVVQALAEGGYPESDTADRLRDTAKLCNAIVHGDVSARVPANPVANLLQDLRRIATNFGDPAGRL